MSAVFIIAEAGVNHNGSAELAKRLVDAAADAGCDAVKFQTFKAADLVEPDAPKADYQKRNAKNRAESQYEMLKKLELSKSDTRMLKAYCRKRGILFLSSPFDCDSADFLRRLGMPIFKIPSGEITNLPYLRRINSFGCGVILSTGMATLAEISAALKVLRDCKVSLLHCTTEYPCPFDAVNLNAMLTMKRRFRLPVGYSDHTRGIEVSVAAVALGAEIIEKHFTLSREMEGPDHKASLEPDELKRLVASIRNVSAALGDGAKRPSAVEAKNAAIARKSIVAKRRIKKGELFSDANLAAKRPATGISPMKWDSVVGKPAPRDFEKNERIVL